MSEPEKATGPLSEIARSLGLGPIRVAGVFTSWPEVVGEDLAKRCRPLSIKRGVLEVEVESSAWAVELRYSAPRIAENVNKFVGSPAVERVEIRVGGRRPRDPQIPSQANDRLSPPPAPTRDQAADAEALASKVGDPRVREALKRAHLAGKMRRRKG